MRRALVCGLFLVAAGFAAAQPPSFDRLNAADRQMLQDRFTKEVWPLLTRGGKESCVACHTGKTALRFTGDPAKDFPRLLRDGFLLHDDDGSLLGRIVDRDPQRRMPPGKRAPWPAADVQVLRAFSAEVDRRQGK